ncbi:4-hydroxy-tetrahydrodipicolinate reductase [Aureococcus anophagefferens]|nr:4-hydroxy-tetrahydrodipicolinate reductase [Aureococcus anophagefferens]
MGALAFIALLLATPTSSLAAPRSVARAAHARRSAPRMAVAPGDIVVMMNGLPGKMGCSVGEAIVARGMELAPTALTGPDFAGDVVDVAGTSVTLVAGGTDAADAAAGALKADCAARGKTLVAVDFTVPAAAEANARYYAAHGLSFVMGTTGADAGALSKSVLDGTHSAVIAPNMSKQIVALQAVVERAAKDFPGAFAGYALDVTESHQASKIDTSGTEQDKGDSTSGTAKAVVASLAALQDEQIWSSANAKVSAAIERIDKVRDEASQLDGAGGLLGKVPAEHLAGHAYHTYGLTSGDGTVRFELRHNVNGRSTYAEGVCDATLFLAPSSPGPPRCSSTIGVALAP